MVDQDTDEVLFSKNSGAVLPIASITKLMTALVVVEAVWQYSHHVLHGLYTHRGPILTVANWSGQWPGLVGLLNTGACLASVGRPFSRAWHRCRRSRISRHRRSKHLSRSQPSPRRIPPRIRREA